MDIANAVAIAAPLVEGLEGFQPTPKYDVNGYAIGYGNHYYADGTGVDQDDPAISQADGIDLMNFYLNQVANYLAPRITVPLNDNQFAALIMKGYNGGQGSFSSLISEINNGQDVATTGTQLDSSGTDYADAEQQLWNTPVVVAASPFSLPAFVNEDGSLTTFSIVGAVLMLAVGLYLITKD